MRELLGRERDPGFERLLDSELRQAMKDASLLAGVPAEDRERRIFTVASALANRMLYHYSERLCKTSLKSGVIPFFQAMGTLGIIHALASPYYLAFFHQHRSKNLLQELRQFFGMPPLKNGEHTALFTDTLHEINGVAMTIKRLARTALKRGVALTVLTVGDDDRPEEEGVCTFRSVGNMSLPEYPELSLRFPPILDVLDYIERHGVTRIHVSTPGSMGMLGLAAAKLMDLPAAATYHTDIPQYVGRLTDDAFLENTAWSFILWFYNQMDEVLVPSRSTRGQLLERGLAPDKVRPLPRWVDTETFAPDRRDPEFWGRRGLNGGPTFLYAGRVSREKNLDLLAMAFREVLDQGLGASLWPSSATARSGWNWNSRSRDCQSISPGTSTEKNWPGPTPRRTSSSFPAPPTPSATWCWRPSPRVFRSSSPTRAARGNSCCPAPPVWSPVPDLDELGQAMRTFGSDRALCRRMGAEARRFIESRAPAPDEVYSTILNL